MSDKKISYLSSFEDYKQSLKGVCKKYYPKNK